MSFRFGRPTTKLMPDDASSFHSTHRGAQNPNVTIAALNMLRCNLRCACVFGKMSKGRLFERYLCEMAEDMTPTCRMQAQDKKLSRYIQGAVSYSPTNQPGGFEAIQDRHW
jgi:hypothetical protein